MRPLPLALIAVLAASPAWTMELGDAPMATAGAAPATEPPVSPPPSPEPALTTAEQIDAFLRASPARAAASGDELRRSRKLHGEVAAVVGSHGYRAFRARADIPVGESGTLSVAVAQSQGGRFGYGYGPGLGYSYGPTPYGARLRDPQRCGLESMATVRPLDEMGGSHGPCRESR